MGAAKFCDDSSYYSSYRTPHNEPAATWRERMLRAKTETFEHFGAWYGIYAIGAAIVAMFLLTVRAFTHDGVEDAVVIPAAAPNGECTDSSFTSSQDDVVFTCSHPAATLDARHLVNANYITYVCTCNRSR